MAINKYVPNILIVTIDPEISNVLGVLLKNLNYKIQLTNSGSGAVEKVKEKTFDLILLDINLQGMNIIQLLNYIKELSSETLVIILAGHAPNEQLVECLNNGAYDFFKKPFEKDEIMHRIKNALERRNIKNELDSLKEKLTSLDQRYEYVAQNSPDFIYTLDEEGYFTYINNSVKSLLGIDSSQLIKKHYSTIIFNEDVEKAKYVFNERRAGTRDKKITKFRLKKFGADSKPGEGKYIVVEVKAVGIYDKPVKHKDKKFLGTHGMARDISFQLHMEESLKLQKAYFRQLFNNSPEAIAILDLNDNIIDVNRHFEEMFQFTQADLKNKNIHKFIVPEELLNESKSISVFSVPNGNFSLQTERVKKDGTVIDVDIYTFPVVYNNKKIAIYHIYRDHAEFNPADISLTNTINKLRKAMSGIINAMVSTVEVRDPYTAGHQQRVADLARAIAQEMGLPEEEIDGIRMAGTLHDLGKVNIPAEILSKPGTLSDIEFSLIKMHPRVAYDILKEIDFPWPIADIVHQHHERVDGSGYPQGLKGEEILLAGKILTVADVVDAMARLRPYRAALGIDKALEEINLNKGIFYDEDVVSVCIRLFKEKRFSFSENLNLKKENVLIMS